MIIDTPEIAGIEIPALLQSMAATLTQLQQVKDRPHYELVGIQTGGQWVADQLSSVLAHTKTLGSLNISFYRDDFTQKGLHPHVSPSSLPFEVDGADIVLVDDVIMSGRTIRAALNELFDFGRPNSVALVTLIDLADNDLPIRPDVAGIKLNLAPNQRIKLTGPDPLALSLQTLSSGSP